MEAKYPMYSTYNAFNNNPIIYVDPDGKDWVISTTIDNNGNKTIHITLTAAVLNSSSKQIDMNLLKSSIQTQVKDAYAISWKEASKFETTTTEMPGDRPNLTVNVPVEFIDVNVVVDVTLRTIQDEANVKNDEHLIQVLDGTDKKVKGTYGVAQLGGKKLWLNADRIDAMIMGNDNNTIPHELGHTGLLVHPDQQVSFWGLIKGEQYMEYNSDTKNNAMWSNGEGFELNDQTATDITPEQIQIMVREYEKGNLNK